MFTRSRSGYVPLREHLARNLADVEVGPDRSSMPCPTLMEALISTLFGSRCGN
jgi:hypothetical protein